ncbi:HEL221Cp [Eremothecium sinecaudum]|uniref:DNA repair protein REV1 n=1 Tax=Eremothecium sinecaudum TaxID=45286 RepID=A0A120K2B9_9SACH|nr:HEL221Cp [Eremothecium sinecaudum]AMD21060.1 HEL221Cp [Eremothecium sinecaudum]
MRPSSILNGVYNGYGEYFSEKRHLQGEQENSLRSNFRELGEEYPPVFKGCKIYINGRTDPDREVLRQIIVLHGGQFIHYVSRGSDVTHIIATTLTARTRIAYKGRRVVRPEWVMACVESKRLVNWQDYTVLGIDEDQRSLALPNQNRHSEILSCKDPGFIESFFGNSRLHLLSTWKARLREDYVLRYLRDGSSSIGPLEHLRVFHVDFDCFFAAVSAQKHGYDQSIPIAVSHGTNNSDVSSCNYVARKFGVRNGMWVSHAKELCPSLVCLPYAFDLYEAKSAQFYDVLRDNYAFDSVLPVSVDEAICVLGGEASVEECRLICSRLRRKIEEKTGVTVSFGCGSSMVLARLALKKAKPDGQVVCCGDDELLSDGREVRSANSLLSDCKLRDLPGIGPSIAEKLVPSSDGHETSISEVRDRFSLDELVLRLGPSTGAKVDNLLHGKDDLESLKMLENPMEYFARRSLSVEINWGIRFDTIHEIDLFIDRLVQYIVKKLNDLGMLASQVVLKIMRRKPHVSQITEKYLGMGECDAYSRSSRLSVPTDHAGIIASEAKSSYRMIHCPPKDLRGIALQLMKLQKREGLSRNQMQLPFASGKELYNTPKNRSTEQILVKPVKLVRKTPAKEFFDKYNKNGDTNATKMPSPPIYERLPSTLRESFLNALPEDLAEEVKQDYNIRKKAEKSYLLETRNASNAEPSKEVSNAKFSMLPPVSFQGLTRTKQIRKLLIPWITQTIIGKGPNHDDLRLFEGYLDRLLKAGPSRLPILANITQLIIQVLDLNENLNGNQGFQEWEEFLLKVVTVKLNQCKQQDQRRLNLTFAFN